MAQKNLASVAVKNHLKALKEKHSELKELITKERSRPGVDDIILQGLKKEKLRLKEEIESVRASA